MLFNSVELQAETKVEAGYQIQRSYKIKDPAWDLFLTKTPGGHHVQTSLWAQVKGLLGWRAVRLLVTQGEQIVAGMQLLIRPLHLIGAIGYVSRGPVFALNDPVLRELLINQFHQLAKEERIQFLVVQPPYRGETFAQQLPGRGFHLSSIEVAPTASILIDLTQDLESILAQMRKKTRQNIRQSLGEEMTVREGTESDLPIFYRLMLATSQRRNFPSFPEKYFYKQWHILNPYGYIKLFLTEYRNEAVSAELVIPFGDTVVFKTSGWSGQHANRHPNELAHWAIIQWAKSHGYQYCDLEGINVEAARLLLGGESLPEAMKRTPTFFKLGFGGQITLFPKAYDYVYNPFLRWGYYTVLQRIRGSALLKNVMDNFRTH